MTPHIERETVDFLFPTIDAAVRRYVEDFGPFVMARAALEPQGRWDEFLAAFTDLVERFNIATDGTVRISAEYLLITVDRGSFSAPDPRPLQRFRAKTAPNNGLDHSSQ